jgi:hypothetical protein
MTGVTIAAQAGSIGSSSGVAGDGVGAAADGAAVHGLAESKSKPQPRQNRKLPTRACPHRGQ